MVFHELYLFSTDLILLLQGSKEEHIDLMYNTEINMKDSEPRVKIFENSLKQSLTILLITDRLSAVPGKVYFDVVQYGREKQNSMFFDKFLRISLISLVFFGFCMKDTTGMFQPSYFTFGIQLFFSLLDIPLP
jgi:hypothetical protein